MIGVEHTGICAKDTKALTDFYLALFGGEIAYDNKKTPATYFIRFEDGTMLEIYPADEPGDTVARGNKAQGLRHIAMRVDDFPGTADKLTKYGVTVLEAPKTTDKGVSTMFFRDPEGTVVHLIHRAQPL